MDFARDTITSGCNGTKHGTRPRRVLQLALAGWKTIFGRLMPTIYTVARQLFSAHISRARAVLYWRWFPDIRTLPLEHHLWWCAEMSASPPLETPANRAILVRAVCGCRSRASRSKHKAASISSVRLSITIRASLRSAARCIERPVRKCAGQTDSSLARVSTPPSRRVQCLFAVTPRSRP